MKSLRKELFFYFLTKGRLFFLVSSVCVSLGVAAGISEYGAPCDEFKEPCSVGFKCIDNKCNCSEFINRLVYAPDGSPICQYHFRGTGLLVNEMLESMRKSKGLSLSGSLFSNSSCFPNCKIKQECLKGKCECVEGYVMSQLDKSCHEVIHVKPLDKCEVRQSALLCDPNSFSICKNSQCICFQNYYYNFTTEQCLLKQSGYKAPYNEYCSESGDCIDGLQCSNSNGYRCQCPSSCPYKEEFGACDCGEVSIESPILVIVIGCIIGIGSVIFWIFAINRTWKRAGYESSSCDFADENNLDSIPPENTFPIDQPINKDNKPNSLVDEPPTYKEAVFSSPSAPIGFNANNTSIVDGDVNARSFASPYVPYFPPPQSSYQDSQNISTAAVGNLPYPVSNVAPTAPSLTTGHAAGFSQLPYASNQILTNDIAVSSATTPYPLSPTLGASDKAP